MSAAVLFLMLAGFWFALSGRFDPLFAVMGLVTAAVVTALTHRLVRQAFAGVEVPRSRVLVSSWRFLVYLGWLLGRMVTASVQIAWLVLHPRMPLDPATVRVPTSLRSTPARVFVANTITLIPGTLTIALEDDAFVVHAYMPSSADDLVSGRLQNMIGRIFGEEPEKEIVPTWGPPREEGR